MSHSTKRRRLFVDYPIQGALLLRVASYWAVSLLAQMLIVLFFAIITAGPNDFHLGAKYLWSHLQLALLGSALILPMILFDVVRLSHRWAGPVFRLRASLQALSRGDEVDPIRFRKGDYWQELAGDFNVVAEELQRRRGEESSQDMTEQVAIAGESATAS